MSGPIADPMPGPLVHYNADGDQIEVVLSSANCYGKRFGPGLVVSLGYRDCEVVGVIVEGVAKLTGADRLREANAEMLAVLKWLVWSEAGICPACDGFDPAQIRFRGYDTGHHGNCILAAAIAKATGVTP